MLTPKFMIPARANGAAFAAFRLPFLALLLSAPLALAAVVPIISGLRITPLNDGFTANWITDTPASSVVFNSVNTSLASDPALVTRHMLVVRGFASCLSPAVQVYVQSVNSGGTATDNNGGLFYPVNTGTAMTRTGTGGLTNVPIYTPVYSLYGGDDAVNNPPITSYNASATWQPSSFTEDKPISRVLLTVNLAADTTCSRPPFPTSSPYVNCPKQIAPVEFQIGLRGPDGSFYPGLDREGAVPAALTSSPTLCMKFYDNQLPTDCANVSLGYGKALSGLVGQSLKGNWTVVVTHTDSRAVSPPTGNDAFYTSGTNLNFLPINGNADLNGRYPATDLINQFWVSGISTVAWNVNLHTIGGVNPTVGGVPTAQNHVIVATDPALQQVLQGTAIVQSTALSFTVAPVCGSDLRLVSPGLVSDLCETIGAGDSNGGLDPRETGTFRPQIYNNGAGDATGVTVSLSSASGLLTFTGNPATLGTIAAGATVAPVTGIGVTVGDSATCQNLPVTATIAQTGPAPISVPVSLQEGIYGAEQATTLAAASTDISAANTPSIWGVSNGTGATFNAAAGRYDYSAQCGGAPANWPDWPKWTGAYSGTPKQNLSEPYFLDALFSNASLASPATTGCLTQANPASGLPDPICFYPVPRSRSGLWGVQGSSPVPYILLELQNANWGSSRVYNTLQCVTVGSDSLLTSPAVSFSGFAKAQVSFQHQFWTEWSDYIATDTTPGLIPRDSMALVEVASSLTDAGTTCSLDALSGRRWCEAWRLPNHSTPGIQSVMLDITAFAAGATNVQVRFRFRDPGMYQSFTGGYGWGLRDIRVQGVNTPVLCNRCIPCTPPAPFAGIQSVTDPNVCADTGVNLAFSNIIPDANWNDGGARNQALRRFRIYRSDLPATPIGTVNWSSASSFLYNDNSAANNTPFNYRVEALNGCGQVNDGAASLPGTDLVSAVPSGFANNTATDGNAIECVASGILVTWTAPAAWNDNGSGVRTFTVLRNGIPVASGPCSGSLSAATLSCTDTTAVANTAFTYTVRANNGCGLTTVTSPGATATDVAGTTPTGINNPTSVIDLDPCNKTGVRISWSSGTIAWNDTGVNVAGRAFKIYRNGLFLATVSAATTFYDDTTGTAGTQYQYQVTALNGCGYETSSAGGLFGLDNDGSVPNFSALISALPPTSASCQVNLSWNSASACPGHIVKYNVYRSTNSLFTPDNTSLIARCIPATGMNAFTDKYSLAGQLYYYVVRAEDVTSTGGTGPCVGGRQETNLNRVGARPNSNLDFSDTGSGIPVSMTGLWHRVDSATGWNCGGVLPFPSPTAAYYYGIDNTAASRPCTYNTFNTATPPVAIANSGELVLNVGSAQSGQVLQFRYQNRSEQSTFYDQFTVSYGATPTGPWTIMLNDGGSPATLVNSTTGWSSASFSFPTAGNFYVRFFFDTKDAIANDFLGVVIDDVTTVRGSCSATAGPPEVSSTGAPTPLTLATAGANINFYFQDMGLTPQDYNIYEGTLEGLQAGGYDHRAIGCHVLPGFCSGVYCLSNQSPGAGNRYYLITAATPAGEGPAEGGAGWNGASWAGPSPPAYAPLRCGNNVPPPAATP